MLNITPSQDFLDGIVMRQCAVTCIICWYNVLDVRIGPYANKKSMLFVMQIMVAYISTNHPL